MRTSVRTRLSPTQTFRWIGSLAAGAALAASPAYAVQNLWTGNVSNDWNTADNWSLGRVPVNPNGASSGDTFDDAVVNTQTPVFPVINADIPTPRDIIVGTGAGSNGRVDHVAGNATATGWVYIGNASGTGIYNLADPAGSGGTFTGMGQSSGNLQSGGEMHVGSLPTAGGTASGVFNVNTTGTVTIPGLLNVGSRPGNTGVMNLDSGTVTTGSWTEVGNFSGTGTLNMSGGSITKSGNGNFEVGTNGATGTVTQTGGAITITSGALRVGNGSAAPAVAGEANVPSNGTYSLSSGTITVAGNLAIADGGAVGAFTQTGGDIVINNGEFWVGNVTHPGGTDLPGVRAEGLYTMSGGSITVNNWVAIGRDSGNGTFNMTGGTITKAGPANTRFIVGANGTGGTGILNQNGGDIIVETGITWIGENQTGTHTLEDGSFATPVYQVGVNGSGVGTANLNGGTLATGAIIGGAGTSTVNFNGTQIVATGDTNEFMTGLTDATVDVGGLLIDSAGFNLTAPQALAGPGGITKTGAGRLFIGAQGGGTSGNAITGDSFVNEGTLMVTAFASASGGFTVADGAGFGVFQELDIDVLELPHLTFGSSGATTFEVDLNDDPGNPVDAPVNVATLTLNGPVTVNVEDRLPAVGTVPLLSYDSKTGSGSFVLGTLPEGMVATLSDQGGVLSLNVTQVALPTWTGAVDNVWDTTTENWQTKGTTEATNYEDGNPVEFADVPLDEQQTVALDTTVMPASVTFDNFFVEYTLTGTGKISGSTGLTKSEAAPVTINGLLNDYTGVTRLQGGTLSIDSLTNGGQPSSIGAATADPANLVLAGGTLEYTGPATTIDRGFTLNAVDSGLTIDNDLTLTGPITTIQGSLNKSGAGDLTFSNSGTNTIGAGGVDVISRFNGGTLTLDGPEGQVVTYGTRLELATAEGSQAAIVIDSNTLNTSGTLLGTGAGSNASLIVEGTGTFVSNGRFQTALGADSTSEVIVRDSGSFSKIGGWLSIGNSSNGVGTMTVQDNGTVTSNGDFNIGDVDSAHGTLNIEDSATVTSSGAAFIGKATNNIGIVNQTGGTFTGNDTIFVGYNGTGTWNLNAGTVNANGWVPIGRFATGEGIVNVAGGTFNHTAQYIWVGEEGSGTLNITGGGSVVSVGPQIRFTQSGFPEASGVINLGDGTPGSGTLTARRIIEGTPENPGSGGSSTFNFNGGTLVAEAGADETQRLNFMHSLDNAVIQAGGAFINSNGLNITIAQPLSGSGPLTKLGAGTLTLSGANTYTGNTTVSEGTLAITSPSLPHPATVTIESGATLALDFEGREQVLALVVDGNTLPDGVYDASSPETAGFITGTGEIEVTSEVADPYADWAAANGLTAGVNDGPLDDPDMDGIANLLEFILGGNPLAMDTSILPAAEVTETDFVFTFNRSDESEEASTQTFQWGTDLTTWNDVAIGATSSGPDGNGVTVTIVENGGDPDTVTVTVPRTNSASGKLFGRLAAGQP